MRKNQTSTLKKYVGFYRVLFKSLLKVQIKQSNFFCSFIIFQSFLILGVTESRSEDDDIEFDEQNIADDNESSNGDPESPTAEAVAKAFLDSVDKYVEYEETDRNHPESAFSPKNGMSGVVYVGQNGNYHHNSNGHAPSGLIADELESDENLQVLKLLFIIY